MFKLIKLTVFTMSSAALLILVSALSAWYAFLSTAYF